MSECQRSQSRVYRDKQIKIERILQQYPHDPDHPGDWAIATLFIAPNVERLKQLREVETEWEVKKQELADELSRVEALLCTAYDRCYATVARLSCNYCLDILKNLFRCHLLFR